MGGNDRREIAKEKPVDDIVMTDEEVAATKAAANVAVAVANPEFEVDSEGESGSDLERESSAANLAQRPIPTTPKALIEEIRFRSERAGAKLQAQLTGSVTVVFKDLSESYLFDFTAKPAKLSTETTIGDCVIRLHSEDLMRISRGDLNPQIGMLSDKINIDGNLSLAVYFFNLVVSQR